MTPQTLQYFADRNISVEFNGLGHSNELRTAYINETRDLVMQSPANLSQNVKIDCYRLFYPELVNRSKFTGFESFETAEKQFKVGIYSQITGPLFKSAEVKDSSLPSAQSFKPTLAASFANYSKPILLYLSGGLDSEFMARNLIDAGKAFTPVIFRWTDSEGQIKNSEELQYAFDFCVAKNLTPIVKTIELVPLWQSAEFKQLAVDIQLMQPQLVSHAWMAKVMEAELPGSQHLFGGEVRYLANYADSSGEMANLIYLNKVAAGFSGSRYSYWTTNSAFSASLIMESNGTWSIDRPFSIGIYSEGPLSGSWAVPPIGSYEYQITSYASSFGPGGGNVQPPFFIPGWNPIVGGSIAAAGVGGSIGDAASLQMSFEIRSIANPALIQSYSIDLRAEVDPGGSG